MNLLDKRRLTFKTGLAMLPALFFFLSCEEPSEIGLELNPNKGDVSTHYVEIPLQTTQIYTDTLVESTVNFPRNNQDPLPAIPIGRNSSPEFGVLTATAFTNIGLPANVPEIPAGATADSVFLRLSYGNAFSGSSIDATQTLKIFRTQAPVMPTDSTITVSDGKTVTGYEYEYHFVDELELAEQIGEISFDTSTVTKNTLKIALDQAFAQELLDKLQQSDTNFHKNQQAFDRFARGLAIAAGDNNTYINNYNLVQSSIDVYFQRNDTTKTVTFPTRPKGREGIAYKNLPTFFHLEPDYSNTALANVPQDERDVFREIETLDGLLYFRAGVGLLQKVDYSAFKDFLNSDTVGTIIINQAILEIDSIVAKGARPQIPATIGFSFLDQNNKLFFGVGGIETKLRSYVSNQQDTLFMYQTDLIQGLETYIKTGDERFLQGLYNVPNPSALSSFVADPNRIRLKVYYTTLKED